MRSVTEVVQTLEAWKNSGEDIRVHFAVANGCSVRFLGTIVDVSTGDINIAGPRELALFVPIVAAKFPEARGVRVEFADGSLLDLVKD